MQSIILKGGDKHEALKNCLRSDFPQLRFICLYRTSLGDLLKHALKDKDLRKKVVAFSICLPFLLFNSSPFSCMIIAMKNRIGDTT